MQFLSIDVISMSTRSNIPYFCFMFCIAKKWRPCIQKIQLNCSSTSLCTSYMYSTVGSISADWRRRWKPDSFGDLNGILIRKTTSTRYTYVCVLSDEQSSIRRKNSFSTLLSNSANVTFCSFESRKLSFAWAVAHQSPMHDYICYKLDVNIRKRWKILGQFVFFQDTEHF